MGYPIITSRGIAEDHFNHRKVVPVPKKHQLLPDLIKDLEPGDVIRHADWLEGEAVVLNDNGLFYSIKNQQACTFTQETLISAKWYQLKTRGEIALILALNVRGDQHTTWKQVFETIRLTEK